ncbi:MAG: hypothetical protein KJ624_06375 [Chloroflexi bacterium]|nr:hypothetical protein [Chloroflexota bacterium]
MDRNFTAYLIEQGSKLASDFLKVVVLRSSKKAAAPEPSSPVKEEEARTPATTAPPSATSATRGTGCRPCTSDHFSTCAGALAEALRFARAAGMEDAQVQDRLALCVEELNIWERVDAAPDKLPTLAAPEREFVRRWLPKGRDLRHHLNEIETLENLEATAALARQHSREARTEMRQLRPPVMSKIEALSQKVKTGEVSNKEALGQLSEWWGKQRPEKGG